MKLAIGAPDLFLPANLRRTVLEWFGENGLIWCNSLPDTVTHLMEMWKLSPCAAFDGATHALVLDCVRADGKPAVLKLPFVDEQNRAEAEALRLYDGDGAVQLLDHDPATGALLLERLFPGDLLRDLSDRSLALDIACGVLRRLRRPAPEGHRFPLLRNLASFWAANLPAKQDQLGHPLPDRVVDEAASLAGDLAIWNGQDVVVNRDPHLGNFLSACRQPWLLIDPKPVLGEAAFDGSFLLLAHLEGDLTRVSTTSAVERIADGLAVDSRRVRAWALVQAVENALWACGLGNSAKTSTFLARAQLLAEPA